MEFASALGKNQLMRQQVKKKLHVGKCWHAIFLSGRKS